MRGIRFVWDPAKAGLNARKHGVTFEEAVTVFSDDFASVIDDPDHSDREGRFVLHGLSARSRVLVVVHAVRPANDVIRIVAARKAVQGGTRHLHDEAPAMRKQYDFSQARANPYAARSKRPVTIRIDQGTIAYFKDLAADTGIPYQTLINSYLRDCAVTGRRPATRWVAPTKGVA